MTTDVSCIVYSSGMIELTHQERMAQTPSVEDQVRLFVAEALFAAPAATTDASALYRAFLRYADKHGWYHPYLASHRVFGMAMRSKYIRTRYSRGQVYKGVAIRPAYDDNPEPIL